ncbi:hypothetical protein F0259_21925 [Vibrio cyclitrophicus]|uniref:hypothetical protein n=1 Tax=Vibrio cyclitrophicus TaxID=47951 RepID=UPI00148DF6D7|nr:hypothetical protein [Vibrio cyclitrophicus]NOH46429.1 hypothetical protein [Vibrio cyclitrophicus]
MAQLKRSGKNKTLYGLRTNKNLQIEYCVDSGDIKHFHGFEDVNTTEVEVSDQKAFNLPYFISIAGIHYYPSKYEIIKGVVFYHSLEPPFFPIQITVNPDSYYINKKYKARITLAMLEEFDKTKKMRPRKISQLKVMGESAKNNIQPLINDGSIIIPDDLDVKWQWCHLIAFTMLPENRAQTKRNLVAGTAACNGHMVNIEAAVKAFIYEKKLPLSLEVTATYIDGSQLATRISYQIKESKSRMVYTEYFDAITAVKTDFSDHEEIYNKLMNKYEEFLEISM